MLGGWEAGRHTSCRHLTADPRRHAQTVAFSSGDLPEEKLHALRAGFGSPYADDVEDQES